MAEIDIAAEFARLRPQLLRFAQLQLRSEAHAEDAVQEALLAALQGHDAELVDPQSKKDQQPPYATNAARSVKPEVFVAIGICTHLGCSPSNAPAGAANPSLPSDWPGGFFCPCHGSTFDGAGRVFKDKPAPTNLEVPPHHYAGDTHILIGEDAA